MIEKVPHYREALVKAQCFLNKKAVFEFLNKHISYLTQTPEQIPGSFTLPGPLGDKALVDISGVYIRLPTIFCIRYRPDDEPYMDFYSNDKFKFRRMTPEILKALLDEMHNTYLETVQKLKQEMVAFKKNKIMEEAY